MKNISANLTNLRLTDSRDRIAYQFQDTSMTFGDIWTKTRQAASWLKEHGVLPRQMVVFSVEDSLEWPIFFHGLLLLGAIPVVVNPALPTENIERIVRKVNVDIAIVDQVSISKLESVTQPKLNINNIDLSNYPFFDNFYEYNPKDISFILSTSGTTGGNKLIAHSQENFESALLDSNPYQFTQDSVILCPGRMSFVYGLIIHVFGVLASGAQSIILKGKSDLGRIHEIANEKKATHLFGGPYLVKLLLNHTRFKFEPTLKYVFSGSEPLPSSAEANFYNKFKIPLIQLYGNSETLKWALFINPPDNPRPGSIGLPDLNVQCRVVDQSGKLCQPGEHGVLWVRCGTEAMCYYGDDLLTMENFKDGWYNTNDIVYFDADGYYFYVSRANQLAKINSCWVNVIDVEKLIENLPGVSNCVVVIDKDENGFNNSVAYVVADPQASTASVRSALTHQRVPGHLIPSTVVPVESIPVTVTNKKLRSPEELRNSVVAL